VGRPACSAIAVFAVALLVVAAFTIAGDLRAGLKRRYHR
jgi:hypothetical protein